MEYIIGTRGSQLALVQANYVKDRLSKAYPQNTYTLEIIKTKGDIVKDKALSEIGGKGVFVKEIERRLLDKKIDLAVHSLKDVPIMQPEGLCLAKFWAKESSRDVLVIKNGIMPPNPIIGTGSMRRTRQLQELYPGCVCKNIRGNIDTRIRKLYEEDYDAIILAEAGINRLNKQSVISQYLSYDEIIPSPGQGTLAIELRSDNYELLRQINSLSDDMTDILVNLERDFLKITGGDCNTPLGAVATYENEDKGRAGKYVFRTMYLTASNEYEITVVESKQPQNIIMETVRRLNKKLGHKVYLVGAGPGEENLITVKGMKLLQQADCIVYDYLSNERLLRYAKEDCEFVCVGKRAGSHSAKQEDINKLLVSKAMKYKTVVRLKGGDPYIFGRGGEEGLYLKDYSINFEVVPAVSSSVAALTYSGVPITHRGITKAFHVITATSKENDLKHIDFKYIAEHNETFVILMGLGKLKQIIEELCKVNIDTSRKVMVVSNATLPNQKVVDGTIKTIVSDVKSKNIQAPAVIVIGEVVGLRDKLDFIANKPLSGKKYIVTKIGDEISGLTRMLEENGAYVQEVKTGEIVYHDFEVEQADYTIFTSKNSVIAYFKCLEKQGLDSRSLNKVISIGESTTKKLKEYNINADYTCTSYNSIALVNLVNIVVDKNKSVCYVRAEKVDNNLKESLEKKYKYSEVLAYTNKEIEASTIEDITEYDGVFFTAASSVHRFMKNNSLQEVEVYSIGPKCTNALLENKLEVYEAQKATYEGLLQCVLACATIS